ncbi:MAG TPA: type II toxin-antitoxin system Phd/YefM family antitoxin [Rubrivivax sp.]|nr:type II toxin-antitoxin system Phd/YefM family antitoxin [Rubrivivax sp.]
MTTVTSVEAQNRFGQLLDMARREPVTVTRHGRPAAFIVSPQDMEELLDARVRRSKAVQALEAWSARASAQATPAAKELSDDDINRLVHELR